jgi:hypothetical protein
VLNFSVVQARNLSLFAEEFLELNRVRLDKYQTFNLLIYQFELSKRIEHKDITNVVAV